MSRAWVIGHRGAPTQEVENTIASFERAVELDGADGLEIDLCVTKDRELVLWHDWKPTGFEARSRQLGLEPDVAFRPRLPDRKELRRRMSALYSDDVRKHFGYARKRGPRDRIASAWIPTLDEFLTFAARKSSLEVVFFDVKIPNDEVELAEIFLARFHELLAKHAPRFSYVLETEEVAVLTAMKQIAPQHCYSLDVGPIAGIVPSPKKYSSVKQAIRHGNACATLLKPPYSCFRPFNTYCRIARHDLALRTHHNTACAPGARVSHVVGFTINDPLEMACAIELGIDGLQTDRPDLLRHIVDAYHGAAAPYTAAARSDLQGLALGLS